MTIEEATILAVLYTDGCLSPKSGSFRLYVSNTSWEIIQLFRSSLIRLFDLPKSRVRISENIVNGKPFYKAVVDSKEIGEYLKNKYGTFRTLRYKQPINGTVYPAADISWMSLENEEIIAHFLKVAFACDGGVNLYVARNKYTWLIRNVYLACQHPTLIKQYANLLKRFDIQGQILEKDDIVRIQGKVNLTKFVEKIGFLDGVKITQNSQYWAGFPKQEILLLLINSYGNPKIVLNLPQFAKSKEIVRTL